MLKITSLIVGALLLSSCTETVENLYKEVMPRPSVVANSNDGATQENIVTADNSSFQSQGFSGSNVTSSSAASSAEQIAVANFRSAGPSFTLHFSYDGTEIDEASTQAIIQHANFMRDNPALKLRLEGHADERGTREYNLALGENRALSVKEVLSLYELSSRVEVISFGEEKPVAQLHNEGAWQKNRRVEFIYH